MEYKRLVFLCGARDFHAMDWYRSALSIGTNEDVLIVTDLIESEGYDKLINKSDKVYPLVLIDGILFSKQSKLGHLWRNFVKLVIFPIQATLLKAFSFSNPNQIYHAHSMYYIFLAWATGLNFIATPQGSDILIKPYKSRLYRMATIRSLRAAKLVTVDSWAMKENIKNLSNVDAHIVQNGIDLKIMNPVIALANKRKIHRTGVLSVRGITELYRINQILQSRQVSASHSETPITFIYPFCDDDYYSSIRPMLKPIDIDLGRVERLEMYKLMLNSKLVLSIPKSDSSPRSVYEAIFCGCAVAITYHSYYDTLPQCMKSRIIVVDIKAPNWFSDAMVKANTIIQNQYNPSKEALNIFDQNKSFISILKLLQDN